MDARQAALQVIRELSARGYEAYLAGGCVRDELLGIPATDFDVATSARPGDVAAIFPRVVKVGAAFGVQLVRMDDCMIEVATFRGEGSYSDGRRPDSVFYTDARQDVLRRDFTINGMLMDPAGGEVLDWVGGRDDLRQRIIRTIGDPRQRFGEDRLRMLRAVRLAARLGFAIEQHTAAAIREMHAQIVFVSPERVFTEISKCITGPRRGAALLTLQDLGLLRAYLPEVDNLAKVEQSPEYHPEGDALTHTALALDALHEPVSLHLAWGTLLHDIGKVPTAMKDAHGAWHFRSHESVGATMAYRITRRLRMSARLTDAIVSLVAHHMEFMGILKRREGSLKRFLMRPEIDDLLALHRADSLASDGDLTAWEYVNNALQHMRAAPLPQRRALISGKDLIDMGYQPGPRFRRILQAVEEAILDEEVVTRYQAREFVRRTFPKLTQPADITESDGSDS